MLTIFGRKSSRFCDGISRRDFLSVGTLGAASLTLADVLRLRARAAGGARSSRKAVIMVCLNGGPSHIDMYDLKPDAPVEFGGEFRPIRTNVPGFDISELMPLQARIADKLALVRSLQAGRDDGHHLHYVFTGFPKDDHRPSFGAIVSRLRSHPSNPLPPYVSMAQFPPHPVLRGHEDAAYVGPAHGPFVPFAAGPIANGVLNFTGPGLGRVNNLELASGLDRNRLADRTTILRTFDNLRRDLDTRAEMAGMDAFTVRALDMISSNRVRDAFDISREPQPVQALYAGDVRYKTDPDGARRCWEGSKFLLARRLVEAGVPVVTLAAGVWDTHGDLFPYQRDNTPLLDRSLYALVTDLHSRGLDQDVAVVVCGEMGRTPRINKDAGRDHWASAGFALFAGGGLRMGQVIGATDARGAGPTTRAYNPQNILATLYHVLGIDPALTFPDYSGRPRQLLDDHEPVRELI